MDDRYNPPREATAGPPPEAIESVEDNEQPLLLAQEGVVPPAGPSQYQGIVGQRGRTVYESHGFFYHRRDEYRGKLYLKCIHHQSRHCRGTAAVRDQYLTHGQAHNHAAEIGLLDRNVFVRSLTERAGRENTRYSDIYEQEALRTPEHVGSLTTTSLIQRMRRARRRSTPPTPHSMAELAEILEDPANSNWASVRDGVAPFFQRRLTVNGQIRGLVFFNVETINSMERNGFEIEAIGIDGTYKVRPMQPPIAQFVTVQAISNHSGTPCIFLTLTDHVTETWIEVLRVVRELFSWVDFNGIEIITDFEGALRNAVITVIPEARLVGCWFHYNQAILRYLRSNRLYQYVRDNAEIRRLVRLVMAIPHLPPTQLPDYPADFHIPGGFRIAQAIQNSVDREGRLAAFFTYVRRYWLGTIGCYYLSLFDVRHRTNNNAESLHAQYRTRMGTHPAIWTFYNGMRYTEFMSRHQIRWGLDGADTRHRSTTRTRNDRLITSAHQRVTRNAKTTTWFLRRVSYAAESYLAQELGRAEGPGEGRPVSPTIPESDDENDEVSHVGSDEHVVNPVHHDDVIQGEIETLKCVICDTEIEGYGNCSSCGHGRFCDTCVERLRLTGVCPMCRQEGVMYFPVFFRCRALQFDRPLTHPVSKETPF